MKKHFRLPQGFWAAGLAAFSVFLFLAGNMPADDDAEMFFADDTISTDAPAVPEEAAAAESAETPAAPIESTSEKPDSAEAGSAEATESSESETAVEPRPEIENAIRQLAAGNARYLGKGTDAAQQIPRPTPDDNSFPLASIFYASDLTPEADILLDLPKKILYTVPIRAGVFTSEELDDLEFGLVNLQTPLVVILTQYPSDDILYVLRNFDRLEAIAKKDAAEIGEDPNLSVQNTRPADNDLYLYSLLGPAVARAKKAYPEMDEADLANVIAETVAWQSIETILMQSDATRRLVEAGEVGVIAAMSDRATGQVYWLGSHPLQDEFLKAPPQKVIDQKQSEEDAAIRAVTDDEDPAAQEELVSAEDLPESLSEEVITYYQDSWTPSTSYTEVVTDYYVAYPRVVPHWYVFYPRVWCYRPWYGTYLPYYVPYPYDDPWWYSGWGL